MQKMVYNLRLGVGKRIISSSIPITPYSYNRESKIAALKPANYKKSYSTPTYIDSICNNTRFKTSTYRPC